MLELLVAMSIMALGVALIYRVAGGNLRSSADLAQRQHAIELAESLLTEYAALPPGAWSESGRLGVIDWRAESGPQAVGPDEPNRPRLRELNLHLSWPTVRAAGELRVQAWVPEYRPAAP